MPVNCSKNGQVLTARIVGEVDHHAARMLMEELGREIDGLLPKELRMDLSGVTFMDSSGIAVVLRSWKKMNQLEGATTLCSVPSQSAKVLKAAGVDKLISFTE